MSGVALLAVDSVLQLLDVDLLHLEHRLHGTPKRPIRPFPYDHTSYYNPWCPTVEVPSGDGWMASLQGPKGPGSGGSRWPTIKR